MVSVCLCLPSSSCWFSFVLVCACLVCLSVLLACRIVAVAVWQSSDVPCKELLEALAHIHEEQQMTPEQVISHRHWSEKIASKSKSQRTEQRHSREAQREGERGIETERERERETDRQRERERNREREIYRDRDREREREWINIYIYRERANKTR